jgi:hypothetical protein
MTLAQARLRRNAPKTSPKNSPKNSDLSAPCRGGFFSPEELAGATGLPVIKHDRCFYCGCRSFLVGPPKGPHAASLTCCECHRISWLSRDRAKRLHIIDWK